LETHRCFIVNLGLIDYKKALYLQEKILKAKREKKMKEDVLLLLEHPPTITIGKKGSTGEILINKIKLKENGISVYEIGRGGKVTYHGPGQLVGYPILNLANYGKDLHLYLRNLEEVIIATLKKFGILATRKKGLTGVWVNDKKIASIGIQVKNWISMHGFALNVSCDLGYFELIQPCGMESKIMSSLEVILKEKIELEDVIAKLIPSFIKIFEIKFPLQLSFRELEDKLVTLF